MKRSDIAKWANSPRDAGKAIQINIPTEDDPDKDVRQLRAYIDEASTIEDLYRRLDVHHFMTQRLWKTYEGRANTEFAKQWRLRLYGRQHPGRIKAIAVGVRRALEMLRDEYRGEIPTLPVESIIHE